MKNQRIIALALVVGLTGPMMGIALADSGTGDFSADNSAFIGGQTINGGFHIQDSTINLNNGAGNSIGDGSGSGGSPTQTTTINNDSNIDNSPTFNNANTNTNANNNDVDITVKPNISNDNDVDVRVNPNITSNNTNSNVANGGAGGAASANNELTNTIKNNNQSSANATGGKSSSKSSATGGNSNASVGNVSNSTSSSFKYPSKQSLLMGFTGSGLAVEGAKLVANNLTGIYLTRRDQNMRYIDYPVLVASMDAMRDTVLMLHTQYEKEFVGTPDEFAPGYLSIMQNFLSQVGSNVDKRTRKQLLGYGAGLYRGEEAYALMHTGLLKRKEAMMKAPAQTVAQVTEVSESNTIAVVKTPVTGLVFPKTFATSKK